MTENRYLVQVNRSGNRSWQFCIYRSHRSGATLVPVGGSSHAVTRLGAQIKAWRYVAQLRILERRSR